MDPISWEDPPPARSQPGIWLQRLEPLMEHPKRWAFVCTFPTMKAAHETRSNLNVRKMRMPPGRWEFASRSVNGEYRLYARYLGPDEEVG